MNSRRLIKRNLIHYRRTHLGVVCGAAVCTAVRAVAVSRLKLLPDGSVLYRLRHMFHDGTKALVFPPLVLIEKLCALIPPPRQNLISQIYRGTCPLASLFP